jgi:hypothetical protein
MICIRYKSLDLRLSPTGYAKGNAYVFCVVKMHYAAKKKLSNGRCKPAMENRWEEREDAVCTFSLLLCIFFLLPMTWRPT